MRKLIFIVLACVSFSCTSNTTRHNRPGHEATSEHDQPSQKVTAKQMTFKSDSIVAPYGDCSIELDFPICEDETVQGYILDYIRDSLISYSSKSILATELRQLPDIHKAGIESFMQSAANQIGKTYSDDAAEEHKNLKDVPKGERKWFMSFRDCDITIKLVADSNAYTSYTMMFYEFTGGAHGQYFIIPTTLRKDNGKPVTNIMRSNKEDEMQPLLWKLVAAVDSTGEFKQTIANYLSESLEDVKTMPHLPLPAVEPWLASDGIHLQYQPYEITPWVYGAPEFVIPIEKAKPYISEEAYILLTQTKEQ